MKSNRFYILSLVVILSFTSLDARGAEEVTLRIPDFSPGLNTAENAISLQPGEAQFALNLDLTKHPGGLTVRDGYDYAFAFPGADSILTNGLITYKLRNGDIRLVVLTDSAGASFGTAYLSDANTTTFNTEGTDGVDSMIATPNLTQSKEYCRILGIDSLRWFLHVRSDECVDFTLGPVTLDTTATAAEIVDSLVAYWPGATSCTSYVDVADGGNSIIIYELTDGVGAYWGVGPFASYGGWTTGLWTVTSEAAPTVTTRLPLSGQIKFAQHNGDLYIVNGVSSGLVFDNDVSRRFPVKAPGEIDAVPIPVDANGIGGVYRYALKYVSREKATGDTTINNQFGVLSGEVEACGDCGVLLSGFQPPNVDQWLSEDTVTAQIWRTTALSRYVDKRDTIWNTGISLSFDALTGYGTIEILDTISDDSLRNSTGVIYADGEWYEMFPDTIADSGATDADTNTYTVHPKPGAPSIISWESASDTGIWGGIDSSWTIAAGWSWFVVRYDTLLGIASDSGRSVNIFQEAAPISWASQWGLDAGEDSIRLAFSRDSLQKVSIVMPRCEDSNFVYLLYRRQIKPLVYDSTVQKIVWDVDTSFFFRPNDRGTGIRTRTKDNIQMFGDEFIALETRLIGQYNPGDTAIDSLGYLAYLTHTPYRRNYVPGRITHITSVDGILYLADDQNVFTSTSYDTTLNFSALNQRPIGPEDGGVINAIWQDRNFVKVGKTNRLYNLYEIDDNLFGSAEVSNNFGVIAPYSAVLAPEGAYIMSFDGVRLLSDGLYRERVNNVAEMSSQLDNFDNLGVADLAQTFGLYWDRKLLYSVSDSTFVLNKVARRGGNAYGWTVWDFAISAATPYRVATDGNAPDTLYFAKPGSNIVYRLGADTKDSDGSPEGSEAIDWQWRSGAFPGGTWSRWQPVDFLMTAYSDDTTSANLVVDFYNAGDVSQSASQLSFGRIDTANVYRRELGTVPESPLWYIDLYTTNPIGKAPPPNTSTTIEALMVKLLERGDI